MTFEELGAMLRSEREKRNLRLEDAADKLKINPRQLRALEEGDVKALPHAAYARGFIRSYATWLGLSADEIQQALAGLNGLPSQSLVKRQDSGKLEMPEQPQGSSRQGLVLLAVLLCLAGAGWWLWQSGKLDWLPQLWTSPKQVDAPLQTADTYMAQKDAGKTEENMRQENQDAETREKPASSYVLPVPGNIPPELPARNATIQTMEAASATLPDENANTSETVQPEKEKSASSTPEPHNLVITAIEECWIHSNADKTDTRQFSLRKGDTFALTFNNSLELKLGNAGGVRLRYDGNDMPPPGSSGQVKTIVFPPKDNS